VLVVVSVATDRVRPDVTVRPLTVVVDVLTVVAGVPMIGRCT
jgi:hypothetical protein